MGELIELKSLQNRVHVFKSRREAGQLLAQELTRYKDSDAVILAIPSGGVPVAAEISRITGLPMDLIIVRKLQIPGTPEAGFGAVSPGGKIVLNESLARDLRLTPEQIREQADKTLRIMEQRKIRFRRGRPSPVLKDRPVIIVDDGLASGYTMTAAIQWVKGMGPSKIVVAVPTGSERTVEHILSAVDQMICLNVRSGLPYAVADAYRSWYDVGDEEVLRLIGSVKQSKLNDKAGERSARRSRWDL